MTAPPCRFIIPIPPSTNNLYRGRRFKTGDYKAWAEEAGLRVNLQCPLAVAGRVRVVIEAPFALNRDLDNIKPALDLAAALGLIENDNRVDDLRIVRVGRDQPCTVSIWPIEVVR